MKKLLVASSLFLALGTAQAAEAPKWDYVDASYLSTKIEGERLNGLGFTASKLINENVFATGSYSYQTFDKNDVELDYSTFTAGIGYRYAVAETTDLFATLEYVHLNADIAFDEKSGISESDNGYGATIGVRSMVTSELELQASVGYVKADESDTSYTVAALYHFNEEFAVGAGFTKADDADTINVTATYFF